MPLNAGATRPAPRIVRPMAGIAVRLSGGCRWIDGDPQVPGWRYCDAPRVSPTCAYCAPHRARAYRKLGEEEAV